MNAELQKAIESLLATAAPSTLRRASELISKTYTQGQSSRSIFENDEMRLCYLAARMPATYGAVHAALRQLPASPSSWLDLGAGPGTASWAAADLFPDARKCILIEKSSHAISLGKQLAAGHPLLEKAEWRCAALPRELPPAQVAILSYSLGELDDPSLMIDRWWHSDISLLVIVEPGTPRGFSCIKNARTRILSLGGSLIAPCPHGMPCPLKESDSCHFSARISRSRLHRYLKGGSLGYEDEKYSYLIASRAPFSAPKFSRILRHPQKNSGHVRVVLCKERGTAEEISIGRSNKEFYRKARDAEWGDPW